MTDPEAIPRPGTSLDLSRRMERIEERQDNMESEVRTLAATVGRVELNQTHAEEMNKLRFGALDVSVAHIGTKLDNFIARINSLISGETRLPQNDALMNEWRAWRDSVNEKMEVSESKLDEQAVLNGQVRLLGRLAVLLVSGNVLAIIAAVAAVLK